MTHIENPSTRKKGTFIPNASMLCPSVITLAKSGWFWRTKRVSRKILYTMQLGTRSSQDIISLASTTKNHHSGEGLSLEAAFRRVFDARVTSFLPEKQRLQRELIYVSFNQRPKCLLDGQHFQQFSASAATRPPAPRFRLVLVFVVVISHTHLTVLIMMMLLGLP